MRAELAALKGQSDLTGAALRAALTALYDGWLGDLLGAPGPGIALVAVGALGRQDPAFGSDLDLVLVHAGRSDVADVAERVWYPVWDSGVGLDHSVRTVAEVAAVAGTDLKAALGLLDARHVAGDADLTAQMVTSTRAAWRKGAAARLPELRALVAERGRTAGEIAFLLEPDLKEGRGGLRDVHALQALAVAQVVDAPGAGVRAAHTVLLDVRGALHRRTAEGGRRSVDRLLMQEQDAVAEALGYADADLLMADVSGAARTIAFAADATWRRVPTQEPRRRVLGRRTPEVVRRPLADDVVEQAGEVVLARDADPATDPVLVLRVARAAAAAGLPIAPRALERLVEESVALPQPWPDAAREELVALLGHGHAAVPVLEALDQYGLLVRLLPEWEHVRSKPQRNSYHRFTVDRHLLEAAAEAAGRTRLVTRPDLLLLGALLHDIGKGLPGDHTDVGMEQVARMGPRLGLPPADVAVLVALVEHHLLLPDVATRRDLADPATARKVADAVGSAEVLDLLHALTMADSAATGPAAWSAWKGQLVGELVERTRALLAGGAPPLDTALAPWQEELVEGGVLALAVVDDEVTVVAPDRPGLLSLAAGVLALHKLDVRSASAFTRGSLAVSVYRVAPRFGAMPDWSVVRADLRRAVDGALPLSERIAEREAAYAGRSAVPSAAPTVALVDDASDTATVVEVRAPDAAGLLHRVTRALELCGLDVRTAHISTLGADVVDAFYVPRITAEADRERVRGAVLAALG